MDPAKAYAIAEQFWLSYGWDPEWNTPSIQDLANAIAQWAEEKAA